MILMALALLYLMPKNGEDSNLTTSTHITPPHLLLILRRNIPTLHPQHAAWKA
jgi:hypothetical protein